MKNIVRHFLIISVFLVLVWNDAEAFEKVGTTSLQFLKVNTDARGTGMGGAYAAVVTNSDAVFWNPGALVKVNNMDFYFSQMDYLLDVKQYSFSGAYNFGPWGAVGIQGIYVDIGTIEETTTEHLYLTDTYYNPGLTGNTFHPYSIVLGVSYAKYFTDQFSFGATFKYIKEDMNISNAYMNNGSNVEISTFAFDLGLVYETHFRTIKLAAVIRQFGPEVEYIKTSYPIPQTLDIGISGYLINNEKNLGLFSDKHTLLLAADIIQPRDYSQQYHMGLEYGLKDILFIRSGYKFNYDSQGFTAGFGLKYSRFRIDYSFAEYGDYFEPVHRYSIGFNF